MVETFFVFAVGYVVRPIGGIIFAHFGDKYGRRKSFISAIVIMTMSLLGIAILPTEEKIGLFAPVLLMLFRMLQGLSFGGEVPGSITFISEHIPKSKRIFVNAFIFVGINLGLVLASVVGTLITTILSKEQVHEFGWRIPFLFGAILGIIAYYYRRTMTETKEFMETKNRKETLRFPFVSLFRSGYTLEIIYGLFLTSFAAVTIFFFLYTPGYASHITGIPEGKVLFINSISTLIFSISILIVGYYGDRMRPIKLYFLGAALFLIASYPLYCFILSGNISLLVLGFFAFSIFASFISGTYPGLLPDLFKTPLRYTGISFIYNISFAIFGGLSPLLCTILSHYLKNKNAPGLYFSLVSLLPIMMILIYQKKIDERARQRQQV